jgi:hypothetical protein
MTNDERDKLIIETHQDVAWIKEWIATQNKYKLMVWGALIAAILSLVVH